MLLQIHSITYRWLKLFVMSIMSGAFYTSMVLGWILSGYFYLYDVVNTIVAQKFKLWSQVLVYRNCGVGPSIYIVSSGLLSQLWKNLSRIKRSNEISDLQLR